MRNFSRPALPVFSTMLVLTGAEFDLLGRIRKETFQWRGMTPSEAKTLTSGWQIPNDGEDTGFRRSLGYSSGWNFRFTPDGAGKFSRVEIEAPGSQAFTELGRWRYEGGRVLGRRIYRDGSNFLEESLTRNELGMLTGIDVKQGTTFILQEEIARDWLGNVLGVKYPRPETVGGEQAVGDAFELDGFDRLIGAKLGIKGSDWGKPYSQITQWGDRKLSYALDKVHNRDQVDTWDSQGNQQPGDTYTQETGSNRYAAVNQSALTYDQNGNLVWDGVLGQMYVFDYLARRIPAGPAASPDPQAIAGVLGPRILDVLSSTPPVLVPAGARSGLRLRAFATDLQESSGLDRLCEVWRPYSTGAQLKAKGGFTQKEIRELSAELHKGLDLAKLMSLGSGTVKSSSGWELIAYYGYDPWNRKAYRSAAGEGVLVYTWDGWKRAEEYEEEESGGTFTYTPVRVFFDGPWIDEHLGYAYTADGGTTWTRYTYLLGQQGTVRAVLDANGAIQERYLYDPYGRRRIYSASWTPRTATQIHNDSGYTGRTHDPATGLLYYRNRWYHPALGRFLTYDPIGLWGDPGNWGNGYGLSGDSPQWFSDPLGWRTIGRVDMSRTWVGNEPGQPIVAGRDAHVVEPLKALAADREGGRIVFSIYPGFYNDPIKVAEMKFGLIKKMIDANFPGNNFHISQGLFNLYVTKDPEKDAEVKAAQRAEAAGVKGGLLWEKVEGFLSSHGGVRPHSPVTPMGKCVHKHHQELVNHLVGDLGDNSGEEYVLHVFVCWGACNWNYVGQALVRALRGLEDGFFAEAVQRGDVSVDAALCKNFMLYDNENGVLKMFPYGSGDRPWHVFWDGPGLGRIHVENE